MKKSFAKVFLVLGLAGFAGQGFAAADIIDQDLTTVKTAGTGAELTIACVGSLTGLEDPAGINGRKVLTYLAASGTGAAGTPGAIYQGTDQFNVNASCNVDLTIACQIAYDGGDSTCDMVREATLGGPVPTPSPSDKIEDIDVSFNALGAYADLNLNDISGVTNENVDLKYEATLGADSSDNKAGLYRVDVDINIVQAP
jgi:hypothetical protein